MNEPSEYRPTGCRVAIGAISICVGVAFLVAMFPYGIIPAAVFIGGGARLIWNVGSL